MTEYERYDSHNHPSPTCEEKLAEFVTGKSRNRRPSPLGRNIIDDCPQNYDLGKVILHLGELVEEPRDVRRVPCLVHGSDKRRPLLLQCTLPKADIPYR